MKFLRHFLAGYRLSFARFDQEQFGGNSNGNPRRGCLSSLLGNPHILLALLFIGGAVVKYYLGTTTEQNQFTGRKQHLAGSMDTPEEEIAYGLSAAPQMAREFGGEVRDPQKQALVSNVGQKLIQSTAVKQTSYRFQFHLLADQQTINAFALPGGQIFITDALLRLLESEDQLAGVLGHEIGHVVGRHSTQQLAKSELVNGIAQGAGMAMSDGHSNSSMAIAQKVASMVNLKYGRDDETEADTLGVKFLVEAGYDPEALIGVMKILKAHGGSGPPQILSSHPDPGNRIEHIRAEIAKYRQSR